MNDTQADLELTHQFIFEHESIIPGLMIGDYPVGRGGKKVWVSRDQLTRDERETIASALRELVECAEDDAHFLALELKMLQASDGLT